MEAKIEVGVAAAKAEDAMKDRQPVKGLKLLLDLVKKYPGNVGALHKYYDFLLNHRIKLSDEERAAALQCARTLWPGVENLEDVFLVVSGEQGIKELFAQAADDSEELARAFKETEFAFRGDDLKTFAFYGYVATAHGDKSIAHNARVGVAELLLRRGEYEVAEMEFVWRSPSVFASPELHQRGKFGLGRCREHLGRIDEAIRDYEEIWRNSSATHEGLLAAERIAQLRLRQDKPACALFWCLRITSARPSHIFSDKQLRDSYSGRMASVQSHADNLASSIRRELDSEAPLTQESRQAKETVLTLLSNVTEDQPDEREAELSRTLRARGLLLLSSSVLDLFRDPGRIVAKAEDLGQLAKMLSSRRRPGQDSELDRTLLEANDAVISSALREALERHANDGTNGDRLVAAYLYYALTRPEEGRQRFEGLISSLSNELNGLDRICSSREFTEAIVSLSRGAGLGGATKAESRPFVQYDMASADDAGALRELAKRAEASGNFDLTIAALERIQWEFSDQVDMADLTFTLGEAYFTNDEFDKAKEAFGAYVRLNPRDEARCMEAQYLSAMSDFYLGDYATATVNLFAFAKNNPGSEFAATALQVALTAVSKYDESRQIPADEKKQFFLWLVKRFPDTEMAAEAQYYLGKLMLNEYKDYRSAFQHLEAALKGNQSDEAAYRIGLCYEALGELDQAEKWFRKVVTQSKHEGPRNLSRRALERLQRTQGEQG